MNSACKKGFVAVAVQKKLERQRLEAEMGCSCFGRRSKLQRKKDPSRPRGLGEIEGKLPENIRHFGYNDLRLATNNFDLSNKIGRGGFGTVYKGSLKGGQEVAVKTLSAESKQGVREFLTEIKMISDIKHSYLVELIGCCVEGANRILVYEYIENKSLDRALLGYTSDRAKLNWEKRSSICLGTAKGLAFLHEDLVPPIVHRDIKASNILLDRDYQPKIGDFGLAKLFPENITHISTRIAGTTGYLAPEYAMGGQLTKMADVYSFGVLILEIVSGRSSARAEWGGSHKLLLEWAWLLYEEGRLQELIDPELSDYPEEQVIRYMKVAFFCTQASARRRPLMSQVADMLSRNIRLNETQLTPPGCFPDAGDFSNLRTYNGGGGSCSRKFSSAQITITEVAPR